MLRQLICRERRAWQPLNERNNPLVSVGSFNRPANHGGPHDRGMGAHNCVDLGRIDIESEANN